jgi:hypothetical protein
LWPAGRVSSVAMFRRNCKQGASGVVHIIVADGFLGLFGQKNSNEHESYCQWLWC